MVFRLPSPLPLASGSSEGPLPATPETGLSILLLINSIETAAARFPRTPSHHCPASCVCS
jgi:hypothetical protein